MEKLEYSQYLSGSLLALLLGPLLLVFLLLFEKFVLAHVQVV